MSTDTKFWIDAARHYRSKAVRRIAMANNLHRQAELTRQERDIQDQINGLIAEYDELIKQDDMEAA